ncbi:hypothetical protein [Stenotrophomonas daejeonensis]|nr:hypothetical protein [Stenotrophomonas daejeonensis]
MKPDYIFVVGVAKAGTTALAGWLVKNGFATYAIPGIKEPCSYLGSPNHAPPPPPPLDSPPLLDASVAYFANSQVTARLPGHGTRIVLCLRNAFERTWSDYRMKKMVAQQGIGADHVLSRLYGAAGTIPPDKANWYQSRRDMRIRCFPRSVAHVIGKHFDVEAQRLANGGFLQRLDYELSFFTSRHQYPFHAVLHSSFYYRGLRMLLDKYQPEDITVLTVSSLKDHEKRSQLVERLTGHRKAGSELEFSFTLNDVEFDEPPPDFADRSFDHFRKLFTHDMRQTLELLKSRNINTDLLDKDELQRHMA